MNYIDEFIFISPRDDCHEIVDEMLAVNYAEDFCVSNDFSPEFITRLMEAGFLIMSAELPDLAGATESFYVLFPKLHTVRSALLFENLHIKKSIRRHLKKYELRPDVEFDRIIENCIKKHGNDWLTPPLVYSIREIRRRYLHKTGTNKDKKLVPVTGVYPASFGLYRDGELTAGEFGVVCGKVYTSYSGYYDEDNAGTVQLILATKYLQENGFTFFDLGMPLDYKSALGAVNVSPHEFIKLFRK